MRTPLSIPAQSLSSLPADRRRRARLRDLCDEVLASFRAAASRDVISPTEREEGRAVLSKMDILPRR